MIHPRTNHQNEDSELIELHKTKKHRETGEKEKQEQATKREKDKNSSKNWDKWTTRERAQRMVASLLSGPGDSIIWTGIQMTVPKLREYSGRPGKYYGGRGGRAGVAMYP